MIGGWLPGEGRRSERIGALLMGYYEDAHFRYAGRVGTGFTERTLEDLAARLEPLRRDGDPIRPGTEAPAQRGVRGTRGWWPRSSFASGPPSA